MHGADYAPNKPLCALLLTSLLLSSSCFVPPATAQVLPTGGTVTHGAADLDYSQENELHINQSSQKTIINWDSFNIGENQLTTFHQPNSRAIAVNRVIGNSIDPTQILGGLKANGQIIVLDGNGVVFGSDSRVDVGGLLVSTGDIKDHDFINSDAINIYNAATDGAIINHGRINAKNAGIVAFVAPTVINNGYITAKLGNVVLASGTEATLDLYGDGLLEIALDKGQKQQILNTGYISADGGYVRMEAAAAADVVDNLILNTGIIVANSISVDDTGKILLYAQGSQSAALKAQGTSVAINAGILDVSSRTEGARGGNVEVLGDHVVLSDTSLIDASGHSGGGVIKIGGDYLGGGYTPTSRFSYVADSAVIFNDALSVGNGGKTIIWSDDRTDFFGRIFARGGALGGDGGFAETSGKNILTALGHVDLTAENGAKGTYLLDPANITIYGGQASALTDASLVSYWNFEEGSGSSAIDGVSGYNGTITGATYSSATSSDPRGGQYSLAFDGGNDHVDFTDMNEIENSNFTISFWARSNTTSRDQGFLYKGNHSTNQPLLIWRDESVGNFGNIGNGNANALSALVYDGTSDYGLSSPTNTFNDTEWHHIAVSVDLSGNLMELYIDGAAQMGGAGNISNNGVRNTNNILRIGESLDGQNDLNGNMDELRIYNAALSAGQITELSGNSFTVEGLEAMSQTADVVLQASDSITLDLQGDTLNMANDRSLSLVTIDGDITDISNGTIQTNRTAAGGNVTITAGGTGNIQLDSTNFNLQNGGALTLSAGADVSVVTANALNLASVSGDNIFLRTTNATSDIALNGTVTSSAAGNSLVIASGRNVINNHGASAIDAGAGRWLVYAGDPAQSSLSATGADFKRYNRNITSNAPSSISETGNGILYSIAPVINVTGQNATREYGDASPVFTSTYTGFINGDTAGSAFSGSATYTAAGVNANAGTSTITQNIGTITSNLGYQFTFTDGVMTIEKAPLTITANDAQRDERQPNPAFTATYNGFKLTDTLASLNSLANMTTTAQNNAIAGVYAITPSGAVSNNYSFQYVDGALTVNRVASPAVIPTSVQAALYQNIQLPTITKTSPATSPSATTLNKTEPSASAEDSEKSEETKSSAKASAQQDISALSVNCLISYEGKPECVIQ
tara:strand:- start:47337 stop:50786 length:3450 start_codon:yes stop_codon:yes gene_type:complete